MRVYSSLFLFFLISSFCFSQEEYNFYNNIEFKNFSTNDGLSQRSVVAILQDNRGFLWFGTRYGLNKYDGNTVKNYNYNFEEEHSLNHNWITALAKDSKGTIWIGTKKGLNVYDNDNDNFIQVSSTSEIWDIKAQDSSYLWIATNKGLEKFNIKTKSTQSFKHNTQQPKSISSNNIRRLLIAKNGDLWINTNNKINVYNSKTNSFKHYNYPNNAAPINTKNNTTTLFQDSDNNIWLGYDKGLAIFNKEVGAFEDFRWEKNTNKSIISAVRTLCEDKEGNLWVGAYDGLYKLNLKEKLINKYEHDITNPKSLSQNSVYKIIEDSRGDLWIGTWAGGVNYYDKSLSNFLSFTAGLNNKNLNYKVVSSIVEDKNENLWIGTEGGGLNFYNKKQGLFTYFKHNPENSNSLSSNNVKAVIKDSKGNFWIGTHDGGLNILKVNKDKYVFDNFKGSIGYSSEINSITTLAEDYQHNIWIGTNEGGLYFYDREMKIFSRINDSKRYLGNFIYFISKPKNKNYLYVGGENGFTKVEVNTKKIYPINFKKNNSISNQVISFYEESNESLWIGTEGEGVFNYNLKTKKTIRYGINKGLPNEVIYSILPDDNGNIWMSTNKGLSRLNIKTKEVKNFDESDGLQGNEFNYGAYLKNKKGQLFYGGTSGFTIFNPNNIKEDTFMPPIEITSFNVSNKPYINNIKSQELITLTYNQNDISFDFVSLGYSQPRKSLYAYKLEGFDTDWNFIGNKKTATYTNLNSGNYTFKVKGSNGDGLWNDNAAMLKLKIHPPLWKTTIAYLSYVLLTIGLVLFIRKYTLLRISDRNELKRERLDKEKMEEVNQLKLQLFTNISHDFRTPLTLIIGPLRKMLKEKKVDLEVYEKLEGMNRNASILLQLINQLLDFRKSEAGKLHLHASKKDIIPFIENIKLSFEELAKERNIEYVFKTSNKSINVWFDQIEMKKVVLNILSNAFKFTPANGKIILKALSVKKNSLDYFKLVIKDSGKGIPKKDLEFVFDRYFQLGQKNELRSGTGVGLALAKDIVKLHHGTISAASENGEGTEFEVLLPMGNEHLKSTELIEEDDTYNDNDVLHQNLDYYQPSHIKAGWINENAIVEKNRFNETLPSILLVEDNIEVRDFIKNIFINDFNIFEAKNGKEGLYIAQLTPIDVIVSDVMMPEMDGIEFCTNIKLDIRTSHIPVILLTARTSSKFQKIGYKTGADVYITKPFDADLLELQVINIIKSRKSLVDKFKKDVLIKPKEVTAVSADEVFLKKAVSIVEENISNSTFNVNTFIEKMHMSQSVLYRKIKVLTGQSISEFIRIIRLKKAGQLLSQTDMSISEIAYDIGFNDLKYFRKCFKKVFHKTPSQYRKSQIKDTSS